MFCIVFFLIALYDAIFITVYSHIIYVYVTCDFFYISGSLVVPPVDHLNMNNIIVYYARSVSVRPLNTVKSWCVTPKVFSRKGYNLMQRAVQIILQKGSLQNIDIRKSENDMMLEAMPMAWRKRILDTTSISYPTGFPGLHEQCIPTNDVKNLNEEYLTTYITENEVICIKTTGIK